MSRTVPVIAGEAMFWAYDAALGVLFIEAARVGAEIPANLRSSAWPELEQRLLTQALQGANAALLLDDFPVEQRQVLLHCVSEAARRIDARGGVSKEEVESWPAIEAGTRGFLRGATHVAAGPVVELAQALVDLAAGTLSPAPDGRHWYYGTAEGRIVQG
ncbi:hypothetical protein O1R50_08365 [Glycomyces luteolus]|uniref:Uncharacterized protein n=1 Tax=Glycomyces luteolus TaxID=2670330 RepID=A0A9X3P9Y4_9ACTN|nr:hypothetical protein [Glycomyces luteolus]MDA1359633.1 hypothetical protein [Glycomyces luteolus]